MRNRGRGRRRVIEGIGVVAACLLLSTSCGTESTLQADACVPAGCALSPCVQDEVTMPAPVLDAKNRNREYVIEGEPPSPVNLPSGCRFHPRCPRATALCRQQDPALQTLTDSTGDHAVACHHPS